MPVRPGVIEAVGEAVPSPAALYLAGLAPASRRVMAGSLRVVATILWGPGTDIYRAPWWHVRYPHSQLVRAAVVADCSVRTARRHLVALRQVLTECRRAGLMSPEDCAVACDLRAVPGDPAPTGRALDHGELTRLVQACRRDPSLRGRRDEAIILLLSRGGLRRGELAGLQVGDLAGGDLRVTGKGGRHRVVHMTPGTCGAVEGWVAASRAAIARRGEAPDPALVWPISRSGRPLPRPLTPAGVARIVTRRAEEAAITDVRPHDLRRTVITDLLAAGVDLLAVGNLVGHKSPVTTKTYDRRGQDATRHAVSLLADPGEEAA